MPPYQNNVEEPSQRYNADLILASMRPKNLSDESGGS
jgi:hypothetical protein